MSTKKNEAIVGRPFTLELDVKTYDHNTDAEVTLDISAATAVSVRLISPDGTATDYSTSAPTSPNYRVTYSATGAELTKSGLWKAVVIYTLGGVERESINDVGFQVHPASPTP